MAESRNVMLNPMSVLTVEKLLNHQAHELATAVWGASSDPHNVALVCEDCQEILADWDELSES